SVDHRVRPRLDQFSERARAFAHLFAGPAAVGVVRSRLRAGDAGVPPWDPGRHCASVAVARQPAHNGRFRSGRWHLMSPEIGGRSRSLACGNPTPPDVITTLNGGELDGGPGI